MKIEGIKFKWLNAHMSVNRKKVEVIEGYLQLKKLENTMNEFEKTILEKNLIPLLEVPVCEQISIVETLTTPFDLIKKYSFNDGKIKATINEHIFMEVCKNITLQFERIDYSGRYTGFGLPNLKSITQQISIEFEDKTFAFGAHYSSQYALDEIATDIKNNTNTPRLYKLWCVF